MLPVHVALLSMTDSVPFGDIAKTSAAIQKQVVRDFGPIWTVDATIDAFQTPQDVPLDYWRIYVVDTFEDGGQHRRDAQGQPYALVAAGPSWPIVASHEALEMLADPFGSRVVAGESPVAGQGRVEFLVEVCDPCQAPDFGYPVNGVLVSDFCTPQYFDPVAAPGVRYSFSAAVTSPRQVLKDGYLSWRDPVSNNWYQQHRTGNTADIKNLGPISPIDGSLRAAIDQTTRENKWSRLTSRRAPSRRATKLHADAQRAARSQAERLLSSHDIPTRARYSEGEKSAVPRKPRSREG